MSRTLVAPLAIVVAAVLAAGCGHSSGAGDACPAAQIAQCLASQQACVAGACQPCSAGQHAASSGSCEPIGGTPLAHDFSQFTVTPGQEVLGLCQSWTLNNAEEIWVNAVELEQDEASHHSNWTYVPDDQFAGPDGVWTCDDRQYNQLDAALVGGVLYAQSTQASHEVQQFPNGAAIRIPPYSRIISDIHLLNTGSTTVTGNARLTLYGLPKDQVKVKLVPFHLTYDGLDLPPLSASRFTGNCSVASQFPGGSLEMKVYYVLPHTHALATRFFLDVLGGPNDGLNLIEVDGFTKEAHGRAYDPPVDATGADGFRFGCQYQNPRTVDVKWGFGDQEMCEVLGFADSREAFESTVATADPQGADGSVKLFSGDCSTVAFAWDFNKPGGPGPM